jgi:4-hydroxy-2-oxoheptanedioate aldolase
MWSMTADPLIVESLAKSGADYVGLDIQHGMFGFDATVAAIQQVDHLGLPALVRIAVGQIEEMPRYLDAGAAGAIIAMVASAEQAADAVALSQYQPTGRRSFGGQRHGLRREPADVRPAIYAMIETAAAYDRVAEIVAVPGLAGTYVGPVDLGLALGIPSDRADSRFSAALDQVVSATHSNGGFAGMFAVNGEVAASFAAIGFDEVVISSDLAILRAALEKEVRAAHCVTASAE